MRTNRFAGIAVVAGISLSGLAPAAAWADEPQGPPPAEAVALAEQGRPAKAVALAAQGRPAEAIALAEQVPPAEQARPPAEQVPPPAEQVPPPAEQARPPEQAPPPPEQAPPAEVVPPADQRLWDSIAACESGGNWSMNSGNGYYGGLQFNRQTWQAHGGQRYAALPHQASREQQMLVATQLRDARSGYGAWPACARKLSLQR